MSPKLRFSSSWEGFFVAAGANVQTYVDPLIEKIETAETIIKTKIGRLEADFAYLETLRTNYIREAEAAAQAE